MPSVANLKKKFSGTSKVTVPKGKNTGQAAKKLTLKKNTTNYARHGVNLPAGKNVGQVAKKLTLKKNNTNYARHGVNLPAGKNVGQVAKKLTLKKNNTNYARYGVNMPAGKNFGMVGTKLNLSPKNENYERHGVNMPAGKNYGMVGTKLNLTRHNGTLQKSYSPLQPGMSNRLGAMSTPSRYRPSGPTWLRNGVNMRNASDVTGVAENKVLGITRHPNVLGKMSSPTRPSTGMSPASMGPIAVVPNRGRNNLNNLNNNTPRSRKANNRNPFNSLSGVNLLTRNNRRMTRVQRARARNGSGNNFPYEFRSGVNILIPNEQGSIAEMDSYGNLNVENDEGHISTLHPEPGQKVQVMYNRRENEWNESNLEHNENGPWFTPRSPNGNMEAFPVTKNKPSAVNMGVVNRPN